MADLSKPCRECPWRRESASAWLGPFTADEWLDLVRSDEPIACHLTIGDQLAFDEGLPLVEWPDYDIEQCRGAAMFRANIAKRPRDPDVLVGPRDTSLVFSTHTQFEDHHVRPLTAPHEGDER